MRRITPQAPRCHVRSWKPSFGWDLVGIRESERSSYNIVFIDHLLFLVDTTFMEGLQ